MNHMNAVITATKQCITQQWSYFIWHIQLSAVITRSNIERYYINNAEYQSDAGSTKGTQCLALTGELWDVFREYLCEN